MSQPLYVRQPCSLQIIQLVECSPPPPQQQQQQQQKYSPSRLSSSSYSDSDDSDSDDGSAYDSSSSSLSAGGGGGPSYCSSAEEGSRSAPPVPPSLDNRDPSVDDTYYTRQRRVSLWRDAVYSKNTVVVTSSSSPSSNNSGSSSSVPAGGVGCLSVSFSRTAPRPASPSQKRKTPDGDLANCDSIVSRFSFRASISPTLIPLHHVRPPTPPHASPPAPHRVHIHVPPVTRTFLPLFPSDNMLPQAETPTKHVALPSNTSLNNRVDNNNSISLRLCLPLTLPIPPTHLFPCSLPRYAPLAMT